MTSVSRKRWAFLKILGILLAVSTLISAVPCTVFAVTHTADEVAAQDKQLAESLVRGDTMVSTDYKMKISEAGIDMIKDFEGYTPYAEWDYSQWTYGYGSRAEYEGQYISESDAAQLLKDIMYKYENSVNAFAKEYSINFNQNQFDALVSFTYNLGEYYWKIYTYENSTIKRKLIDMPTKGYDREEMIETFCLYCHAGGSYLQGLYDRRAREGALFCFEEAMIGDLNDTNTDYYVLLNVNNSAYMVDGPASSYDAIKRISRASVLPVIRFNDAGTYGLTVYRGQPGWINKNYLVKLPKNGRVSDSKNIDTETGYDTKGFTYSFDHEKMTATLISAKVDAGSPDTVLPNFVIRSNKVYTLTGIESGAFEQNTKINTVYIPPEITYIGETAFDGSAIDILYYDVGSYGEKYAVLSGYNAVPYDCARGHIYGTWQDTEDITVQTAECAVCGYKAQRRQIGIEVSKYPDKLEYYYDKSKIPVFYADGLEIKVLYDDGSHKSVEYTENGPVTCTGFNGQNVGNCPITVKYNSFTTTFNVKVTALVMTSLTIVSKPSKTTYIEGNTFNKSGLKVRGNYNDGSSVTVENYSLSGYKMDTVGTHKVKVTYSGLYAYFNITVKQKSPTGFKVNDMPARMEYYVGDSFDPFGLTLTVSYNNETTEVIDHNDKLFESLTFSGFTSENVGNTRIKLDLDGFTRYIDALIIQRDLETSHYGMNDTHISGVKTGVTLEEFASHFEAGSRIKVTYMGRELARDEYLPSGALIRLWYNSDILDERVLLVTGDPVGNGVTDLSDYLSVYTYVRNAQRGESVNTDPAWIAGADLNLDGKVTLTDLVLIRAAISLDANDGSQGGGSEDNTGEKTDGTENEDQANTQ